MLTLGSGSSDCTAGRQKRSCNTDERMRGPTCRRQQLHELLFLLVTQVLLVRTQAVRHQREQCRKREGDVVLSLPLPLRVHEAS